MNFHENELDHRLRSFFRGEMPQPWPKFHYPTTPRSSVGGATRPTLPWARCIVGVCLALFFALYLALAGQFRSADGPVVTPNQNMLGSRPDVKKPSVKIPDIVPMPMRR
jgi:hypothetical protein